MINTALPQRETITGRYEHRYTFEVVKRLWGPDIERFWDSRKAIRAAEQVVYREGIPRLYNLNDPFSYHGFPGY